MHYGYTHLEKSVDGCVRRDHSRGLLVLLVPVAGLWYTWQVARSESEVGSTLGKLYYLVGASSNGANLHQLLAAMRVVTLGLLPIGGVVIVNDNP